MKVIEMKDLKGGNFQKLNEEEVVSIISAIDRLGEGIELVNQIMTDFPRYTMEYQLCKDLNIAWLRYSMTRCSYGS